jgi:hypothetical protein
MQKILPTNLTQILKGKWSLHCFVKMKECNKFLIQQSLWFSMTLFFYGQIHNFLFIFAFDS